MKCKRCGTVHLCPICYPGLAARMANQRRETLRALAVDDAIAAAKHAEDPAEDGDPTGSHSPDRGQR